MTPAPVTRDCGCRPGESLCPTAQHLRKRVNETLPPFELEETERTSPRAYREHHRAVHEFKKHVGGSR